MINKRDSSIDIVAGIMIVYMIFGHCCQSTGMRDLTIYKYMHNFLSFFMPWFFYKSGMFFTRKSMNNCFRFGVQKLLKPFFLYSVIGHLICCIKLYMEGDRDWIHYILSPIKQILLSGASQGNLPLWFLFTLFWVKLFANSCIHNCKSAVYTVSICFIFACAFFYFDIKQPLYLANICTGLFFFAVGYLLKDIQYNNILALVSCCIYIYLFFIGGLTIVDMRTNTLSQGLYIFYPVCMISGIIFINNLFKRMGVHISFLEYVGKNSMVYYVLHWPIILLYLITLNIIGLDISEGLNLILLIIVLSCLMPIINVVLIKVGLI